MDLRQGLASFFRKLTGKRPPQKERGEDAVTPVKPRVFSAVKEGEEAKVDFQNRGPFYQELTALYREVGLEQLLPEMKRGGLPSGIRANFMVALAEEIRKTSAGEALTIARVVCEAYPHTSRARLLAELCYEREEFAAADEIFQGLISEGAALRRVQREMAKEAQAFLKLKRGLPSLPARAEVVYRIMPEHLLWVADESATYSSGAIAVRTQELVGIMKAKYAEPVVITRFGYPFDTTVAGVRRGVPESSAQQVKYRHFRMPSAKLPMDEYMERALGLLSQLATQSRPAALIAGGSALMAFAALVVARRCGVPFVYDLQRVPGTVGLSGCPAEFSAGEAFGERYELMKELEALCVAEADYVLAASESLAQQAREWGAKDERLFLVPSCLAGLPEVGKATKAMEEFVIAYNGELESWAGVDICVEAAIALRKAGLPVRLLLAGKGSQEGALADQLTAAADEGEKWWTFEGEISSAEWRKRLRASSVLVVPTRETSVAKWVAPASLMEAMALGVPVVASDLPIHRAEICHGETGLLIAPGSSEALQTALGRVQAEAAWAGELVVKAREKVVRERVGSRGMESFLNRLGEETEQVTARSHQLFGQASQRSTGGVFDDEQELTRLIHRKELRVATVMDTFTRVCFQPECQLLLITPEGWQAEMEQFKPHFFLIESAWAGNEGAWKQKVNLCSDELVSAVEWCRLNNVPIVFWSKEDPVATQTFMEVARMADVILTTDVDCITIYHEEAGHERIDLLPFAAQPAIHHPIEKYERKEAFCFAGSYYRHYPVRQQDFARIIAAVRRHLPVEIYDRNFDNPHPHYTFPDEYRSMIIGSLPAEEIDRAYKGYRYAININTVKQSQTMGARRIFELIASNTTAVSNFTRSLRVFFGDLTISSDNEGELSAWLERTLADPRAARQIRLMALRKVMREHTYEDRLISMVSWLGSARVEPLWKKSVAVLGMVCSAQEARAVIGSFQRQAYEKKTLILIGEVEGEALPEGVSLLSRENVAERTITSIIGPDAEWVALFDPEDFYGEHYLMDLLLASRYSDAAIFGKQAYHLWRDGSVVEENPGAEYRPASSLQSRSSLIRASLAGDMPVLELPELASQKVAQGENALAIDAFNYCRNGADVPEQEVRRWVCDLEGIDQGVSFDGVIRPTARENAQRYPAPMEAGNYLLETIPGEDLLAAFEGIEVPGIELRASGGELQIISTLSERDECKFVGPHTFSEGHPLVGIGYCCMVTEGSLSFVGRYYFVDAEGNELEFLPCKPGVGRHISAPDGWAGVRFGFLVKGSGRATIRHLMTTQCEMPPPSIVPCADVMLVDRAYPSYEDIYRHGFVHSRLRVYRREGIKVDVYEAQWNDNFSYREFEGINVSMAGEALVQQAATSGNYKAVLVHFLQPAIWNLFEEVLDEIKVIVWLHGSEIQSWERRSYEFEGCPPTVLEKEIAKTAARHAFWRNRFSLPHPNVHYVFVSRQFAEECFSDVGARLPEENYSIIHNVVDTDLFAYRPKQPEHRLRFLSIRAFRYKTHANDLTVAAIVELSKRPFFKELHFRIVGDGPLFDEVTEPVREFENVTLEKRFMQQSEIAAIHADYGVMLIPTRMDTQGVSRDEAMSSGLVPITSNVAAIPEFVDETCGYATEPESAVAIADAVEELYHNPDKFLAMSVAAAERVRRQTSAEHTVMKELALIRRVMGQEG